MMIIHHTLCRFMYTNKHLNNYMLDSGACVNMMSLKVMKQLGLKTKKPYRNVCGFESRAIPTHGVLKNVKVMPYPLS
jgi:hypothetical protein